MDLRYYAYSCYHPHLHGLVSKGGFTEEGIFHPLPWIDTRKMALLFRDKVFTMLIKEGKISEYLAQKVSSWAHSGFNIHNGVEINADDEKGKENLAQYIIKAPISQERMIYDKENQKVIYNSKRGTVIYEPLDWLCCEFSDLLANKGILEFAHHKCLLVLTNKNIYANYTDFQKRLTT